MANLNLTTDELLSTTRAVRKRLDFDRDVTREVLMECMQLALQAPSGSNAQGWQFLFVTDPEKRAAIAAIYKEIFTGYAASPMAASSMNSDDPTIAAAQARVLSSAQYLADNMHRAPVLFIPCTQGRVDGVTGAMANTAQSGSFGSIIPAAWSFMLAARSRGLGTCLTTMHLIQERKVAEILDIPYEEVTQVALIPVAYTLGTDFKAGPRKPIDDIVHFDSW
jgi:nitroreductase